MTTVSEDLDQAAAIFGEVRPRLFGIAYRMLGSASEAEDIVQDVWLRWQLADRSVVLNPAAYLATATTRLAINATQSARVRRESYIGPWLPEPVDTSADPYLGAERGEALAFAVLLLMERLSPNERAAYVLREAFDYPYSQIADILQLNEPAVRQLVSRARKHVDGERRVEVDATEQQRLLTAFVHAAKSGDLVELEDLFAADVTSVSDGNGKARASKFPVVGSERVAKFFRSFHTRFWVGVEIVWTQMNGQPAAVLTVDGQVRTVLTVSSSPDGIFQINVQMNPDKLARLQTA
ncbi:RNA polymerase sigma-70 factor [Kribbella albertanoniae]|uniref:RNA polymerase sigma-70 factor n=1 Tax=Kribbella albertanoniae TaxID=1266829 RepID=A0A4R4PIM7_9ACTN|nr:RNA polymerase sigma-70 factor [Kribbella albertanoniae]TDC21857.1 RNA polymerase sigma-70 factor [Kribbella albertanoniae]